MIGVVSLLIWAVVVVVTLKYVVFIMRADNKGEGGTLSLMALAQKAVGRRSLPVFLFGVMGAALFYGDSIITPAISVLSAAEGLKLVNPAFQNQWNVIFLALGHPHGAVLGAEARHGQRGEVLGPIMVVWFAVLAILGIMHIEDDLGILAAFNPYYAGLFVADHGVIGLIVLGSVFLAVTGAEALYARYGPFRPFPIRAAWLFYVFPALTLNYLGQALLS